MLLGIRNDLVHGYNLRLVPSFHFQFQHLLSVLGVRSDPTEDVNFITILLVYLICLIFLPSEIVL